MDRLYVFFSVNEFYQTVSLLPCQLSLVNFSLSNCNHDIFHLHRLWSNLCNWNINSDSQGGLQHACHVFLVVLTFPQPRSGCSMVLCFVTCKMSAYFKTQAMSSSVLALCILFRITQYMIQLAQLLKTISCPKSLSQNIQRKQSQMYYYKIICNLLRLCSGSTSN